MDFEELAVVAVTSGSVAVGMLVSALASERVQDGRSYKKAIQNHYTIHHDLFYEAYRTATYNDGWFKQRFRCSKDSLDEIVRFISTKWLEIHGKMRNHTKRTILF